MSTRSVDTHAEEVAELLAPVSERISRSSPEVLSIDDPRAVGRPIAGEIRSEIPLPPFTNSQMDGYAVRAADLAGATPQSPIALPLGPVTAAGNVPLSHRDGTASPVMTGAAVPFGADAIVPVEHTDPPTFPPFSADVDAAHTRGFSRAVEPGEFVRHKGEDLPQGGLIAEPGTRATAARIGLIASSGVGTLPVRRRPHLLLITTGDEVIGQGKTVTPGRIFDANAPMLSAAMVAAGAHVEHRHCPDRAEELLAMLSEQAASTDLVVTSGGISAGAFEVVREALAPHGVRFMSVAMQPGGPQGMGTLTLPRGGFTLPVLCFPGNPVSALLSAEVFLLPWLRELLGAPPRPSRRARPLAHEVQSPATKLQLRRGTLTHDGEVRLTDPGSHLLSDLADAEIIAEIPAGTAHLAAGNLVTTWRINV